MIDKTKPKEAAWLVRDGSGLQGMHAEDAVYDFELLATPDAVLVLLAEIEALHQALQAITAQIDGNIRPTVRDCVNGQNNVQDIYSYCDQIESIAVAAMKEPQP